MNVKLITLDRSDGAGPSSGPVLMINSGVGRHAYIPAHGTRRPNKQLSGPAFCRGIMIIVFNQADPVPFEWPADGSCLILLTPAKERKNPELRHPPDLRRGSFRVEDGL